MKFTLSWLKQHLDTEADAAAIGERLTALGLEVEGILDRAKGLQPFTVAYVVEVKPHPNADRLSVCIVDTGGASVQVVCGAPNARAGMKGVFAPAGVRIPGTGLDLKKGVIRGVESHGMLCSAREMGLGEDHAGIIELPGDAPVGRPFAEVLGLDPVFDVAVTPDRADCLGVRGIARDLAAAELGRLKPFDFSGPSGGFESPLRWHRDFPAGREDACPLVVGRYFRGVGNGASPRWLQDRLAAIGLRPISALVDITNYVTFDLGRPLHVFDADKLAGDLTMRLARDGEEVAALDGKTYRLDSSMTVIADRAGVQGIGGVMGAGSSGCTPDTRNVFLEVALFDPLRTAATGRKLGVESDARFRFERGVDPQSALWGAEVAARLVRELCGGEASATVQAGEMPAWRRRLGFSPARVMALGGLDLPERQSRRILESLGFAVEAADGVLAVEPPSWRADVEGEADLVEEVLRVAGFDAIPALPLPPMSALPRPAVSPAQRRVSVVKRALAARGLVESVTYSFMAEAKAAPFLDANRAPVRLANPLSADLDVMRPSILPNLIDAALRNRARGVSDLALFEVGPQYLDDTPAGQSLVAAGLRAGTGGPRHWARPQQPPDAFAAKADALALLVACGAPVDNLQTTAESPSWYHPGRSGALRLGGAVLAHFGELNPRVLARFELEAAAAFEAFLDRIPLPRGGAERPALRVSPFQPVERDFAFLVDEGVPAEKLLRAVKGADKELILSAAVFDVYAGEGVPAGKKSLAIAVGLQAMDRTLTEAEIDEVSRRIVAAAAKATGAVLRG